MRGTPNRINTKQDLFNICKDLHHAEAKIFLKEMEPEELKRLGVIRDDIKQIKTDLANRKRKETLENRKLSLLRSELNGNQMRLEEVRTAIKEKSEDLKMKIAGQELIDPKTEELKTLHAEMAEIRKLPDQTRGISEILRDLNGVLLELGSIGKVTDAPDLVKIREMAELVTTRCDEVAELRTELKTARIVEQQKRSIMAKLSEIEEITQEIKELRDGAESIDQIEQELQELGKEIKRLEAEEAELNASLREV